MIDMEFIQSLKLKSDEQIFDALYMACDLEDKDFKELVTEAMIRLVGIVYE